MGGEFVVSYVRQPALVSVSRWWFTLKMRLISFVVSLLIAFAVWYFFGDRVPGLGPWMVGFSSTLGAVWVAVSLAGWLLARRELTRIGQGPALAVTRDAVWIGGVWVGWPQIGALRAAPRSFGRSPDLVVDLRDGRSTELPLHYLDALPATIDSAIRALSGGRTWIDLSRLDD